MSVIEVLYFDGCPHHAGFVPHLRALLDAVGVDDRIHERAVETDADAQAHRFLGSPTLRIDGADVDPTAAQRTNYGLQCRLYPSEDGRRGTPPDEWIRAALQRRASRLTAG
ncbi:DF family (seleno)protein [Micromonospora sp. IBHARD004]|uniref:DF family (seleno)protein n=1 Tax=Micromonospora sp. IBHARD004 TaxID=3457764 RepID=UPI00405A316A